MANLYCGTSNLGPFMTERTKLRPLQPQYCVSENDWKPAPPVSRSHKGTSHQHPYENIRACGEHVGGTFSPQPQSMTFARKLPHNHEFRAPPVPKHDTALFKAPVPYPDKGCSKNYLNGDKHGQHHFSKSFIQPQNDLVGFKFPSYGSYGAASKLDDTENEMSANALVALVNKLLEDNDCDNLSKGASKVANSQSSFLGNESIGELAIKLADIALIDNITEAKPSPVSSNQLASNKSSSNEEIIGKFHTVKPASEETNLKTKHYKKDSCFATSQCEASKLVSKKKNDVSLVDYKKKKYFPHSGFFNKQNAYLPKESRNVSPVTGIESCLNKRVPRQPLKGTGAPFLVSPPSGNKRSNGPFHRPAGNPVWMQLSVNDSRSEGSSSSNSSVYKDSALNTPVNSQKCKAFCKSNESEDGPFSSSKQPHRPRKACSSSSSSSGGGKYSECVFCKTNGETTAMYRSHVLKDDQGRTICKVLQNYVCPLCGATGFNAHTLKYCPENENPPPVATMTTLKSMRSSTGRKRHGPCSGQILAVPFGFNRSLLPA